MSRFVRCLVTCGVTLVVPGAALGQSFTSAAGPPVTEAKKKNPPAPRKPIGTTTAINPSINASQVLLFAWLDDAYTADARGGSAELSYGRWQATDAVLTDLPAFGFAYGLTSRVQLDLSTSIARATYEGVRFHSAAVGDTYVGTKIQLADPDEHAIGVAVSPTVEILSSAVADDPALDVGRVKWVLPLTVHWAGADNAVYSTVTYFSRGVASVGLEAEHDVSERLTVAGLVTYAYATRLYFVGTPTPRRSRTDIGAEVYYEFHKGMSLLGSIGRTISTMDVNAALLTASIGLKVEWEPRAGAGLPRK
jgi:hypothetical protein